MSAALRTPMSTEEFLAWEEGHTLHMPEIDPEAPMAEVYTGGDLTEQAATQAG